MTTARLRSLTLLVVTAALLVATASTADATGSVRPRTVPPAWGTASVLDGSQRLNVGAPGLAPTPVTSISCVAPSWCGAGGAYVDAAEHSQALVATQNAGVWHRASELAGSAALNVDGGAHVTAVSCPAPGTCSAAGDYTSRAGTQALVATELHGVWSRAREVPGSAALNRGGDASITSLSCGAVGSCSAGGFYTDGRGDEQAFVVNELGGTWGRAQELPHTAALNLAGTALVEAISCRSAGSCAAGGTYTDGAGEFEPFVDLETAGAWGAATEVPGVAVLSGHGAAGLDTVSCGAANSCSAGGFVSGGSRGQTFGAYVVNDVNGTWGRASLLPGSTALRATALTGLSCSAPGSCSAVGNYVLRSGAQEIFVASEHAGAWGEVAAVRNAAALNAGGSAMLNAVSCGAPGSCAAVGFVTIGEGTTQAIELNEVNGTWGPAQIAPGTERLSSGLNAQLTSVSCLASTACSAIGSLTTRHGADELIVASRT